MIDTPNSSSCDGCVDGLLHCDAELTWERSLASVKSDLEVIVADQGIGSAILSYRYKRRVYEAAEYAVRKAVFTNFSLVTTKLYEAPKGRTLQEEENEAGKVDDCGFRESGSLRRLSARLSSANSPLSNANSPVSPFGA